MTHYPTFKKAALVFGFASAMNSAVVSAGEFDGFWSSGYGGNGKISFELTVINDLATFKYDASGWGALGYDTCQYVFKLNGSVPEKVMRNTAYGNRCLPELNISLSRANADQLIATVNPEFEIDGVELWGALRPLTDTDKSTEVPNLDILGVKFGMTREEIEDVLEDQGYALNERDTSILEYQDYTIEQYGWGKEPDSYGENKNNVYVTFTAKKSWLPDAAPVAATIGRYWWIPESEGLLGATLLNSIEAKYGPRSNPSFDKRNYGRDGKLIADLSCPEAVLQDMPYTYIGDHESGNGTAPMGCAVQLDIFVSTDYSTGRAQALKMRMTDANLVWGDFWENWSHGELADMEVLYNGLFNATGKGPSL